MFNTSRSIFQDPIKANQLASLFRYGISVLISILLVRFHWTKDAVGAFEYLLLFALTFSFFWTYAYSNAILSRLAKMTETDQNQSLQQIFYQLIMIGIVMAGMVWVIMSNTNVIDTTYWSTSIFWMVALYVFVQIINPLPETIFILKKQAKSILLYQACIYAIQFGIIAVAILQSWTIQQVFQAYLLWQVARLIYLFWLVKPHQAIQWSLQKRWFLYAVPLVLHFILGSGMDYLDGHIVSWYYDEEQFLYYRYGARELPFSLLLLNALGVSMIPILSKNITDITELRYRVQRLGRWLFPVSIVFLFVAPFLFQWIYGEAFIQSAAVFNIYILIITSRILLPHVILYAKEDNRALMYFSALELIVNLVLSLILIQYWSYYGVAMATVIAFLFNRILSIWYCKKKFEIGLNAYLPVKEYALFTMLLLISFLLSYQWLLL